MRNPINDIFRSTDARDVLWGDIRSLLALAAPIIGITLSRMLMGFADFIMVSRLGTEATAAISPASFFLFMGLCIGMGAVSSVQTFTAQSIGRGEPKEAPAYVWQAAYVAIASIGLAFWLSRASDGVWGAINSPPGVQTLQSAYCRISFWAVPFGVMCAGLECFFNGIQKPGVAFKAILAALVCNVVGNYVLIFGKFGFPEMGIEGAAVATVIGWAVRAGVMAAAFVAPEFRQQFETLRRWRLNVAKLRGMIVVGGPTALQWLLDIGAWFLFLAVILQDFGTETLAASNIGIQYMHVAFMPAIGVGIALCTSVGHAIGEGRPDIAARKTRAAILISSIYMGSIGLIFLIAPRLLIQLVSTDAAVIQVGIGVLIWAALFQVFDGFSIIYINALRGAGDTRWPAVALTFLCWGLFIGGGLAMVRFVPTWKHHGPWMMCTLYITILGIVLWRRFAGGAWRKIDLFKRDNSAAPLDLPVNAAPEPGAAAN